MAIKRVQFTLHGQTYDLTWDSAAKAYQATVPAPGESSWHEADHKFYGTVTAEDAAGNRTTAGKDDFPGLSLRVLELTAPVIGAVSPSTGSAVTNNRPPITWQVTDEGSGVDADTITLRLDAGAAVTDGIVKTAIPNGYACAYTPPEALADGAHTVTLAASDHDGNAAAPVQSALKVDTVPPTLTLTGPADGLATNQAAVQVAGVTNDATSSPVTVTVNGAAAAVGADGTFSAQVELTEGENTITVVATDSAGKSSTITRTVTLDTVAPVITAVTLTPNPVDAGATYLITVAVTDG